MIELIEGEIEEITQGSVVVNHGGIGFGILVPQTVLQQLPERGRKVRMYTHFHVREDGMQLYGFLERDDRALFRMLITVNGIGPKVALGILGVLSADDIRFAILADDAKTIAKAPGIGPKTARKLILELKDKLELEEVVGNAMERGIETAESGQGQNRIAAEAVEALTALGYSLSEAAQAVRAVPEAEDMTVEELLKSSLKQM